MSDRPHETRTAALLQCALDEHLEAVMTVTDTERELSRFRQGVRRNRRGQWMAAAAAMLVVGAVGGALTFRDEVPRAVFGNSAPRAVTGSLTMEVQASRPVELDRSDQNEYRDVVLVGTADISADGQRSGAAELVGGGSTVVAAGAAVLVHAWGTAEVVLDGQRCAGTYGYSYYYDPREGGGSLNLSCEDGAVLGAGLVPDYGISATDPRKWTVTLTLKRGFYVAG